MVYPRKLSFETDDLRSKETQIKKRNVSNDDEYKLSVFMH